MKKKEGSVDRIAIALFTIIIGAVLILSNISFAQAMETKSEITSLVRQHILDMESNGALTLIQKNSLEDKLDALGVIDLAVNYGNPAATYGQVISIEVTGKIALTQYDYDSGKSEVLVPFKVKRSSIAKYE